MFFNKVNNMPVLHLYTLLGGVQLLFFYSIIYQQVISQFIRNSIAILFVIFVVLNSIFWESIFTFNSNALTLQAALLTTLSLAYFGLSLQSSGNDQSKTSNYQWINSGIFIYFSSNLLLYYFSEYILEEILPGIQFLNVWTIYSLPTFAAYTCYSIGLWKITRHSK
jgi:hypothetical protein